MLPEVGASELMVLAAVALIVVGPKDLPILFRKLGQFMTKIRGMAAEFRSSFDEMSRQAELDELRKEVNALRETKLTDVVGALPDWGDMHGDEIAAAMPTEAQIAAAGEASTAAAESVETVSTEIDDPATPEPTERPLVLGQETAVEGPPVYTPPADAAPTESASAVRQEDVPAPKPAAQSAAAAPAQPAYYSDEMHS